MKEKFDISYRYESGVAIFHMAIRNCFSGDNVLRPLLYLDNEGFIIFKI